MSADREQHVAELDALRVQLFAVAKAVFSGPAAAAVRGDEAAAGGRPGDVEAKS